MLGRELPPALIRFVVLIGFWVGCAGAEAQGEIQYTVRVPEAHTHYAEVEARVPTEGRAVVELMMAVWTPGSYLVREYARHVEQLTAEAVGGGDSLAVTKVHKNRWNVACSPNTDAIRIRYKLYCRELSVRTNWVEKDFAFLNGAAAFVTLTNHQRPYRVRFELPAEWKTSVTGLPAVAGKDHEYLAPSFDTLVDCPIVLGNPTVHPFDVAGKKHFLVNLEEKDLWDGAKAAADVKKIVETQRQFWGKLPYEQYHFLNLILESGGGLEHSNSTLMLASRWSFRDADRYRDWLGLVSHEFFHTWNVKRLRPIELGPFDYEQENLTRSLWIVEGLTSYYDDLLLRRAGHLTEKQYLQRVTKNIESLQNTPGRLVHPLEMTSYDAWIKFYRRDENSRNSTVSYYTKGAVVGFLLDVEIRRATGGEKSLDDVMRRAYEEFSGERGYTPEDFRSLCNEVAKADLSEWFRRALESTEELNYAPALDWYGLRFKPAGKSEEDEGDSQDDDTSQADTPGEEDEPGDKDDTPPKKKAWLGLFTRDNGGRLVISRVQRETPAHAAGLNVDDEILALNGYRIRPGQWDSRRKQYKPTDRGTLLIARRGALREIPIVFAEEPQKIWKLQLNPEATEDQKNRRKSWLTTQE